MVFEAVRSISLQPVTTLVRARRFVTVNNNGLVNETAVDVDAQGVSLEESAADDTQAISVALLDGAKVEVEAGIAITQGARIASDAQGRAVIANAAAERVLGVALTAAGAAGEVITLLAKPAAGEFTA